MLDEFINFDFDLFYAISQVFALAATVLGLVSIQEKKKVQLLNYNFLSAVCAVLHYLFLGAWSGAATKTVTSVRNGVAAYEAHKNKTSKVWPAVFVIFYVVGGVFTYESPFSLLPVAAPIIFTLAIYLGNIKTIRYAAGVGSLMWLIYNIHVFSLVGIASETLFIINDLIAIWRYRKRSSDKKSGKRGGRPKSKKT